MPGLQWVRLDTDFPTHDKILALTDEKPEAVAYRAAFSYVCSLGYAGSHATDGLIPFGALRFIHGTKKTAELLVRHLLWFPDQLGWRVVNFEHRQQLAATTTAIRKAQRVGGAQGNCVRWHGEPCGCWKRAG